MTREQRILLLEDVPSDAQIIEESLRDAGLTFSTRRVSTREEYIQALNEFSPDIVLANNSLPAFDALGALHLASKVDPMLPVVVVAGSVIDEQAVELLRAGARDYVLKDRMARLVPAVKRALTEASEARQRNTMVAELKSKEAEQARQHNAMVDADRAQLARVQLQSEAIDRISISDALLTGDVERLARKITEEAARVTGVARASVWLFNDDETELRCIDLYEATPRSHTAGTILRQEHFVNEFRALKHARYIDADTPMTDPRTAGYFESYLKPTRITSKLDVVAQVSSKYLGLLCLEHVDQPHHWEQDEITFSSQLSDKIGLAITNRTRLQALEKSEENERRFRTLVEQSVSGFYLLQDGKIAYANARFAEIFGYASPEEILGKTALDLIAGKDRAMVAENIRRRLSGEVKSISYSCTGVRKDGSTIELGVHGTYIINEGRPAVMGLLQDITERKRSEEVIQRYVARLEQAMRGTIGVITAIGEARDPYTHGHERRVGEIAAAIGTEMGLDASRVEGIRIAGYMHDVGKIAVPAEILSKPGKLTKPEYELVKGHAERGYEILKGFEFPWPVAEIAWQHHERLDGSGYPRGLKGDEILLDARILAVADTIESMASHRPYRPGLGLDKALAEISKSAGTLYDQQAVDACRRLFIDKGYQLPE